MTTFDLSIEQKIIVEQWIAEGGPMIVEAAAGSGKTRILTECVRRLLSNKEKYKVLCITFTNIAAEELKERVDDLLNIKERATIGTIHGFSLNILKSFRHEIGYSEMPHIIEREADKKEILKEILLQNPFLFEDSHYYLSSEVEKKKSEILTAYLDFISEQKKKLVVIPLGENLYSNWSEKQFFVYQEYNQRLKNQNLIDYDDILLLTWTMLTERSNAISIYRRLYKYVLIDEAQDLNYAQYQIVKAICADSIRNIFMVGDPNQAIHGYAGASKEFMLNEFVKDFNVSLHSLKTLKFNYRSSKAVIEFANLIFPNSANSDVSFYDGNVQLYEFDNENMEAKWVTTEIKNMLNKQIMNETDRRITLDNIAVLGRNKFVFNELKKELNESDLRDQFILKTGIDTLEPESTFIKVFELGARIIFNRSASVYLKKLLVLLDINKTDFEFSKNGLEQLTSLTELIEQNCILNVADYKFLLSRWYEVDQNPSLIPKCLATIKDYIKNIENEDEQILATYDIENWESCWKKYVRSIPSSSISFEDFRRFTALGRSTVKNKPVLTLSTVHSAKGLEFEIVFLIGMGQGTFPDYRSLKGKALQEEKNNMYVAITRAKRILFVSYPKRKKMPWGSEKYQMPSEFLKGNIVNPNLEDSSVS